ncbi:tetratricopeptide repeat protein [Aureibaculum marinum]|uniref:Tetratricopeptide repeat protein n=1 Tax=Aureibaculum marinum TaxID=2487930 RepID=A0A3N4NWV1_9FLAO|nr:tetratricopeptide repeat protein [Aureibaculum marinum]RPD96670.1 tetratricopeptide repeat protein [Aureibaculum marinum]
MKRTYIYISLLFLIITSCVENPNVTEDVFFDTYNPSSSWVNGLKRQLALTMNQVVINSEMTSDNYFNNYTLYSKVFDKPEIVFTDLDVNRTQVEIGVLREMAEYAIETVLPKDSEAVDSDWSYAYFSKAYALILAGENFIGLPDETNGIVLSSKELLLKSLSYLDLAIEYEPDISTQKVYELLKARVYRSLGDTVNAKLYASKIIGETELLFNVYFDGTNGVINEMQNATFTASENRFAPLPRLDFLDPKYYDEGTAVSDQKPIALVKAEEAYLILAEALTTENKITEAKTILKNLITDVIENRPIAYIDDSRELRNGSNRDDYPKTAVNIRFDNTKPYLPDYVLDRQSGKIKIHTISGTKVTTSDINNITTLDEGLYLIYRLRQEIFISEGRRSADLGIKFPVSETEQQNNPNISDKFTQALIPNFIPLNFELDNFLVDSKTGNITILHDMNSVLVANKTSEYVLPFN